MFNIKNVLGKRRQIGVGDKYRFIQMLQHANKLTPDIVAQVRIMTAQKKGRKVDAIVFKAKRDRDKKSARKYEFLGYAFDDKTDFNKSIKNAKNTAEFYSSFYFVTKDKRAYEQCQQTALQCIMLGQGALS